MEKPIQAVMCVKQQGLMQQATIPNKEGDGDAVSYSPETSMWSNPAGLCCGSNIPHYMSDFEDQAESLTVTKLSDMGQGPTPLRRKKGKDRRQKTHHTASLQVLKLPPIKSVHVPKPRVSSANMSSIKELKSQVWDLQQQLSEARTENKLLKRVQHRHTVALQHYQDTEDSLSQILTKHNNEARVLQGLLRETRVCRDNLARQLQASENKLLSTRASLMHLQMLNRNHSLLEREELTFRLTKATAGLEEKDKKIVDLGRKLELCQSSFNRQIVTEQRKINEARKISCYLQEQIYRLNREIQDRERENEWRNIYSHRLLKGPNKKGAQSKMVQTDALLIHRAKTVSLLQSEHNQYTATEEKLEEHVSSADWCSNAPVQESLVIVNPEIEDSSNISLEENHHGTETCADTIEQNICSEETTEHQAEVDSVEEKEASEAPRMLEEGPFCNILQKYMCPDTIKKNVCSEKTPEHQTEVDCVEEKEASEVVPQVFEDERSFCKFLQKYMFPDTIKKNVCSEETPEHQTELNCVEEEEDSGPPLILEEVTTEKHVREVSYFSTESKRKAYKMPKSRRNYTFKQSIENLHIGKPAYSSADLKIRNSTNSAMSVETQQEQNTIHCDLSTLF